MYRSTRALHVFLTARLRGGEGAQRLVAAKARPAKQGLSIPRLELVSAHTVTNLLANVRTALEGFPVTELNGWLDSMVALFWINGGGQYKQFVETRVQKNHAQPDITWRHVHTQDTRLMLQIGVVILSFVRFGGMAQSGWQFVNIGH